MSELNYERDVTIAHDSLDIEFIQQPSTYMKWATKSAEADRLVREAKEKLEQTDAEADLQVRAGFEGAAKKPTEAQIKSLVSADKRHIEATIILNDAIYNANICSSAVRAMEQKKTALENLVKMVLAGYFAAPQEPRDLDKEMIKKTAKAAKVRRQFREGEI